MRRFLSYYRIPRNTRVIRGIPRENVFNNNSYNSDGYTPPENINMEEERQIENTNEPLEDYFWQSVDIGTGGEPERPSIPVSADEALENLSEPRIPSEGIASTWLRRSENEMLGTAFVNLNRSDIVINSQGPRVVETVPNFESVYQELSQDSIERVLIHSNSNRRSRRDSNERIRLPKKRSIQINLNIKNE